MKLFLLLTLVFCVSADLQTNKSTTSKPADKNLIIKNLNELVYTIIDFEKEAVNQIAVKLNHSHSQMLEYVNMAEKQSTPKLESIEKKCLLKLENIINKDKKQNSECLIDEREVVKANAVKAETNLKSCTAKSLEDVDKYYNEVQKHIDTIETYITEMRGIVQGCNAPTTSETTMCITNKSQRSRNLISTTVAEAKDNLRKVLKLIPTTHREIHHCLKKILHGVQKDMDQSVKKVLSCVHRK